MRIARFLPGGHAAFVPETLIERSEVVALLFNVSDIATILARFEGLLEGDDGEEEADGG
ncbi:MAG TPA: hypothetical protein VH538_12990 [Gaiellaceae bacterium]